MNRPEPTCPAELTLKFIEGRWKIIILWHLARGVKRSSQLSQAITGISRRVLTQQLRQMEQDGLVNREVFAQVPPRVDYSLTPLGESLMPIVEAMCEWAHIHRDKLPQP
ncbi:MAG: helix-turn-helix domain-containing protein [Nostoc sp.]|uniref:winged helix-turn-helix transcriptional regulator n=1 Tax=Nostoc sp. TaxID=1180 RepID=UPI002FEFAF07